jgi:lysozyme
MARVAVFLAVSLVGMSAARGEEALLWQERCSKGEVVRGIDVSSWQGEIDWGAARGAGVRFAYVRVSDGATAPDPQFARNWLEAARAGVVRGAYQYFRPAEEPEEQADLWLDVVGAPAKGDLPPALDVETSGDLEAEEVVARIERWVSRVRRATTMTPVIYTSASAWVASTGNTERFRKLALWIAHHEAECPNTPAAWPRWTFHQSSASSTLEGVTGPVDVDLFQGTFAALERLRLRDGAAARAAWKKWRSAHPAAPVLTDVP